MVWLEELLWDALLAELKHQLFMDEVAERRRRVNERLKELRRQRKEAEANGYAKLTQIWVEPLACPSAHAPEEAYGIPSQRCGGGRRVIKKKLGGA